MIKNAKFVEEVSQEFDKDDEIVVVCVLSCSIFFFMNHLSTKF
jgi:hypoxanthine-guanine phosphoribosyltransferase